MSIPPDSIPKVPRGVRVHFDKVRNQHVLLAPERAITLDPVGQAILGALDGTSSFAEICTELSQKYDAPLDQITTDCAEFIEALMERRILELAE